MFTLTAGVHTPNIPPVSKINKSMLVVLGSTTSTTSTIKLHGSMVQKWSFDTTYNSCTRVSKVEFY